MSKRIKMVLYGEPGTGKSTFALNAPNPFFICTDQNYSWLKGAKEENHEVIDSMDGLNSLIDKLYNNDPKYQHYDTVALDLVDDVYKIAEQEYCQSHKLEYIGDEDNFGRSWFVYRQNAYLAICKLLLVDKNIILISHESSYGKTDRYGKTTTIYIPSNKIPIDKPNCWENIEGKVMFFLRCYKTISDDGKNKVSRILSLIPKENEFGIARNIDENLTPHDIALDWNVFVNALGVTNEELSNKTSTDVKTNVEIKEASTTATESKPTNTETTNATDDVVQSKDEVTVKEEKTVIKEQSKDTDTNNVAQTEVKQMTQEEKVAEMKRKLAAKLAAMKK